MDLRDKLNARLKDAMREKDQKRVGTLRLINAALKDQDIVLRSEGKTVGDVEALAIMAKMVKQRHESARVYEEGGRLELAEQELAEIGIIEEFLPRKLSEEEAAAALDQAIKDTGAESIRDMGKVMAALKAKHQGQMDFSSVGQMVKARLG